MHLRMNGYRSDYFQKLHDKPVAEHFNTTGHTFEDLTVMVIEQIASGQLRLTKTTGELLDTYTSDLGPRWPQFRSIGESHRHQIRFPRRAFRFRWVWLLQLAKRRGSRSIPPLPFIKNIATLYIDNLPSN